VVYASSSSALATGSALSFDGTTLSNSTVGTPFSLNRTGAGTALIELKQSGTVGTYLGTSGVNDFIIYNGSASELARFNSTGLGIGTSSPAYKLDVEGNFRQSNFNSGSLNGYFGCANTGSITLNFGGTTTPAKGRIFYSDNSDLFAFYTNSTERARIDSSGNVGINGTTSGGRLVITQSNATQPAIYLPTDESTIQGSSANTKIDMGGNLYLYSAGVLGFVTAGTVRMTLPAAGGVKAVTTISVGNATPSSSGAGITFPATQSASSDANTLDDYEEGTWTPSDISGAGLSLTNINSSYVKIGRMILFTLDVEYPVTASTLDMRISLPFDIEYEGGGSIGYISFAPANQLFVQLSTSVNGIRLQSNSGTSVKNVAMSAQRIQISACYRGYF
jgi:hypothetical protein